MVGDAPRRHPLRDGGEVVTRAVGRQRQAGGLVEGPAADGADGASHAPHRRRADEGRMSARCAPKPGGDRHCRRTERADRMDPMPEPGQPAGFQLVAPYQPTGDQPTAIAALTASMRQEHRAATLLGVTGSGKTFTMANVIAQLQRPTLVLSHNKTLAAQLYAEFKGFFPQNAVEYFVSYYDYYQPEAYVPSKDLYIEKESSINEEIDKLRLSATRSLLSRRDVIIVASVSSIYGLGSPKSYEDLTVEMAVGEEIERDALLGKLLNIQYNRSDLAFQRGKYRVRGDVVELWPAYDDTVVRIEFFGDEIAQLSTVHALTGEVLGRHDRLNVYPAKHFVVEEQTLDGAIGAIEQELEERHRQLLRQNALVEAQRLL